MNSKEEFVKVSSPDKQLFADLLDKARGENTMKGFAELCGVNPSTFSRISNKMNKGASSPELLEIIANNAASDSGVTLEELMFANGYVKTNDWNSARAIYLVQEGRARDIVLKNVLNQVDVSLSRDSRFRITDKASVGFDIVIDNASISGKRGKWLLDVVVPKQSFSVANGRRFEYTTPRENDFFKTRIIM